MSRFSIPGRRVTTPDGDPLVGRSERGQSLTELALVLPILLIIVAGALDLGRLFAGWFRRHPDQWCGWTG